MRWGDLRPGDMLEWLRPPDHKLSFVKTVLVLRTDLLSLDVLSTRFDGTMYVEHLNNTDACLYTRHWKVIRK